jgi:uncharacterized protein (DUF1778 family)
MAKRCRTKLEGFKCSHEEKLLIEQAAQALGLSRSEFARCAVVDKARKIVARAAKLNYSEISEKSEKEVACAEKS